MLITIFCVITYTYSLEKNPNLTWPKFCEEFPKKFEDIDTDMDIWESINSRRQGKY